MPGVRIAALFAILSYRNLSVGANDAYDIASNSESIKRATLSMINEIPDPLVNKKVHLLLKEGKFKEVQAEIHEYLEGYIAQAGPKEKATLDNNKNEILRIVDEGIKAMEKKSEPEFFPDQEEGYCEQTDDDTDEEEYYTSNSQLDSAIAMIDQIPDKDVNKQVHEYIKRGDKVSAKILVRQFLDKYVSEEECPERKAMMLSNKKDILLELNEGIEHYNEFGSCDSEIEESEPVCDSDSKDSTIVDDDEDEDDESSKFEEILSTLPDPDVRNRIMERMDEGHIDEAETEFKAYLLKYISDHPEGNMAKEAESHLLGYVTSQFKIRQKKQSRIF